LLEAAAEVEDVMKEPAPTVNFAAFGDSSLDFQLWVWTETMSQRPQKLRGAVNFKIWDKLKKYEIEIPYPQRDLYVKEWPGNGGPGSQSPSEEDNARLKELNPSPEKPGYPQNDSER
jgi:small-conductance mechanosensitive channel